MVETQTRPNDHSERAPCGLVGNGSSVITLSRSWDPGSRAEFGPEEFDAVAYVSRCSWLGCERESEEGGGRMVGLSSVIRTPCQL